MFVQDLINQALLDLGVLQAGQTPSADDSAICFAKLNNLLDSWNLEEAHLYTMAKQALNLTATKNSYQIGPGAADFNQARPVRIRRANAIVAGVHLPMEVIAYSGEAEIEDPAATSVRPLKLYNDYAAPISNLIVYPTPAAGSWGTAQLELYTWVILPPFVTLQDVITLPTGYQEALEYNLAVRMAPIMGRNITQDLALLAADRKAALRAYNTRLLNGEIGETLAAPPAEVTPAQPMAPAPPQQ